MDEKPTPTMVFNYGSNSIMQLRTKLNNPTLEGIPAKLFDYERVFAGLSSDWGKSGVVSLYHTGTFRNCTFGTVVDLDISELKRLDVLEGVPDKFTRITVSARVATEPKVHIMDDQKLESVDVFCYIKNDFEYLKKPAPWYLTSIQMMLNETYGLSLQSKLSIKAVEDDQVYSIIDQWQMPKQLHNFEMRAFFVLVNHSREKPWTVPTELNEFI